MLKKCVISFLFKYDILLILVDFDGIFHDFDCSFATQLRIRILKPGLISSHPDLDLKLDLNPLSYFIILTLYEEIIVIPVRLFGCELSQPRPHRFKEGSSETKS